MLWSVYQSGRAVITALTVPGRPGRWVVWEVFGGGERLVESRFWGWEVWWDAQVGGWLLVSAGMPTEWNVADQKEVISCI